MRNWRSSVLDWFLTAFQFVLEYSGPAALWAGILAWQRFGGRPLPQELTWALLFGSFAATSFSAWRKQLLRAREAEAALAAQNGVSPPIRKFLDKPEALLQRYTHTGVLAERLLVPYLDRWIRVHGRLEGTADSLSGDAIFLSLVQENGRRIQLRFPADARERLRLLRQGEPVSAECQVRHGYGEGVFTLENCVLTSSGIARPLLMRAS